MLRYVQSVFRRLFILLRDTQALQSVPLKLKLLIAKLTLIECNIIDILQQVFEIHPIL